MFCRYCGNQIPDDSAFCMHCGKPLGVSEATLPSEPIQWQRMTIVIEFRRGEAGWVAQEKYTSPVAQQHFWNDWQPLIQDLNVMVAEGGWQPLGEHGPACVELESYKSAEGRSAVDMVVGAAATYGANLLFAKTWKFAARSITLRWQRPATEEGPSERELRLRLNTQTGEWEPWCFDEVGNRWVILDESDSAGSGGAESRYVESQTAQHPSGLTAEEAELIRLLAQGCSDNQIRDRLNRPGLDVNRMTLFLCGKFGVKSQSELIERARQAGFL